MSEALKNRCIELVAKEQNIEVNKNEKDYNMYREAADMTTTHEAFQFLIRKFVETDEGVADGLCLSLEEMSKKKKETKTSRRSSVISLNGSMSSLNDSDGYESARQSR